MIEETPSMTIVDLLSNIGGLLGLYGGLSFLTLGQGVELIFYLIGCFSPRESEKDMQTEQELHEEIIRDEHSNHDNRMFNKARGSTVSAISKL
jgi:hypothetical protein